jgi:hypothetical protein
LKTIHVNNIRIAKRPGSWQKQLLLFCFGEGGVGGVVFREVTVERVEREENWWEWEAYSERTWNGAVPSAPRQRQALKGNATFFFCFFFPTSFFFGCQLLHLLTSFVVVLFLVASATVSLIFRFVLFCDVVVA